ncbi:MAG TPA: ABC transporter ATP-binding protein [Streptosporangiaceae bacterium]|nr:ABC transporter ATP-binding protein [Streptosporangiaceae bacterium]
MIATDNAERAQIRADSLTVTGPAGDIVGGVSFSIPLGRTLGIVGESGSGKSLTAKAVSGLLPAALRATGTVTISGTEVSLPGSQAVWRQLRGHGVTMLLQDPFTSLSPTHRCGDQIAWTLRGGGNGMTRGPRAEIRDRVITHLAEVNLPAAVARRYPGELSGGMRQRVAIAAALAASPRLLIADEPTTALDASNQRDVLDLLARLQREHGMAMVLISHDLGLIRGYTDEVLVMYAGRIVEEGPTALLSRPVHPYTAGLQASDPPIDARLERLVVIPGRVPEPGERPPGCAFADRCSMTSDLCRTAEPPLVRADDGRAVACFNSHGPIALELPAVVDERWQRDDDETAILRVEHLVKTFAGRPALQDVSIEVRDGESVGLVGESGSGKTTLARCIAGLEKTDSGEILFRGTRLTSERRTASQIQVVFQDPYSTLNPRMRVGAALAEALRAGSSPAGGQRRSVGELLDMVGLPKAFARRYPAELSGGERQRVAIARSLAPVPELLICDESVSALDVSVQAQILNLLSDLRQELGLSVLFISHDLAVVRQISDAVYVISGGRVVESGLTRNVLKAPRQDYTKRLVAAVTR